MSASLLQDGQSDSLNATVTPANKLGAILAEQKHLKVERGLLAQYDDERNTKRARILKLDHKIELLKKQKNHLQFDNTAQSEQPHNLERTLDDLTKQIKHKEEMTEKVFTKVTEDDKVISRLQALIECRSQSALEQHALMQLVDTQIQSDHDNALQSTATALSSTEIISKSTDTITSLRQDISKLISNQAGCNESISRLMDKETRLTNQNEQLRSELSVKVEQLEAASLELTSLKAAVKAAEEINAASTRDMCALEEITKRLAAKISFCETVTN